LPKPFSACQKQQDAHNGSLFFDCGESHARDYSFRLDAGHHHVNSYRPSTIIYGLRLATGAKHYGDRASSPVQAVSRVIATNPGAATSTQESESPAPTAESLSCEAARHNLTILSDQSMGVASVNDAGVSDKSVPMNEKERTQALAKANREVKAYCLILGAGKPKAATNPTSEQSASRPSQSGQF
jgi:hypothetical protein